MRLLVLSFDLFIMLRHPTTVEHIDEVKESLTVEQGEDSPEVAVSLYVSVGDRNCT